jgi:uncharacterized hydrophobic protein (TIGR00271 family)
LGGGVDVPVLVIVTKAEEAGPLVRWGARFAWARETTLSVLTLGRGASPAEPKPLPRVDADDQHPVRVAVREAAAEIEAIIRPHAGEDDNTFIALRGVTHPEPVEAAMAEIKALDADLLLVAQHHRARSAEEQAQSLSAQMLKHAPCDTMVLRAGGTSGDTSHKILVPASGGPHAQVALRLAAQMAHRDLTDEVTPLYVEPVDVGEDAIAVGQQMLEKCLKTAGVRPDASIVPRVVTAASPGKGIAAAAGEGFDLVLVGASNHGFVNKLLFTTVPDHLMSGPQASAVAVLRRARPLATRTLDAFQTWLEQRLPQLQREERIDLFQRLQSGSRANVDFLTLIALSTSIASLGLLQDSPAVVIGAMLVAPLMMPMIGAGLALVQGNVQLVQEAARSILLGFFLALSIGFLMGLIHMLLMPGIGLSHEILARGTPNVLDLLVAFLSGLAAAYALARPGLMGAMAGVAIAAALVPPIGTTGICLAKGEYMVSRGAALLFGTNLVAIVLGASIAFMLIGVRGTRNSGGRKLWARRAIQGLFLLALLLAVPLASVLLGQVARKSDAALVVTPALRHALGNTLADHATTLVSLERAPGEEATLLVVIAAEQPNPRLAGRLATVASERAGRQVKVQVLAIHYDWSIAAISSDH